MYETAIALSIPVFFALVLLEVWVASRRGVSVYRFNDAVTDLSCGIGQQMTGLLWKTWIVGAYVVTFEHVALTTLPVDHPATWVAALLLVDHQYYWWHRATHRSRLFWTTHVVHHQSEDYNLAVALRQTWFSAFSSVPFYLPLAVMGVPPLVFGVAQLVNLLYQFWIHTELIGRLGPLEAVFNTPSHHRVHHGVDPLYIDKNYAGILIVWDRMYGTFQAEEHTPTYGTVTPLRSWNPLWANLEPWVEMTRATAAIPGLVDKVRYVLGPPEWRPASLGGPVTIPEPTRGRKTWDAHAGPTTNAYIATWFVLTSLATTAMLAFGPAMAWPLRAAAVTFILWTTASWSGLFERRAWALPTEVARLALAAIALGVAGWFDLLTIGPVLLGLALLGVSATWVLRARRTVAHAAT